MSSDRERKGDELVALVDRFKLLTADERLELASRADLSEQEQLALSVFSEEEPAVADTLLENPAICDAAAGVAESMRPLSHRQRARSQIRG